MYSLRTIIAKEPVNMVIVHLIVNVGEYVVQLEDYRDDKGDEGILIVINFCCNIEGNVAKKKTYDARRQLFSKTELTL